jgi:hypothetical protein
MIIFWAKNASTTTTTIGKAALLKNLLTGCFAYLPGELTITISRRFSGSLTPDMGTTTPGYAAGTTADVLANWFYRQPPVAT